MPRYRHVSKKAHRRAKRRFRSRFTFKMAKVGVNIKFSMDQLGKALGAMTDRMVTGVSQNQIFWRGYVVGGIDPAERKEIEQPKPIFTGDKPYCPNCGEYCENDPISRSNFRGPVGDRDWRELHACPKCGQRYEFINGDS